MGERIKLLILGIGSLAREVFEMANDFSEFDVAGFVVNEPPFVRDSKFLGKRIFWIDELESIKGDHMAICALVRMRKSDIIQQVNDFGIHFCSLVHPAASISSSVKLGTGLIIKGGVQIGPNTSIGNHVILGRGVLIGDYVKINDYSFISIGTIIAGYSTIGSSCFVGLGSMVLDKKIIGDFSIIGAGSLVTKDIPERVKVMGSPAVIVEKNINGY
jgi:acetyltransferase EpsM